MNRCRFGKSLLWPSDRFPRSAASSIGCGRDARATGNCPHRRSELRNREAMPPDSGYWVLYSAFFLHPSSFRTWRNAVASASQVLQSVSHYPAFAWRLARRHLPDGMHSLAPRVLADGHSLRLPIWHSRKWSSWGGLESPGGPDLNQPGRAFLARGVLWISNEPLPESVDNESYDCMIHTIV